jgi:hypothetical protein
MFRIGSSWKTFLWRSMMCFSVNNFCYLITFDWKLILLDIRMAIPACFVAPFAWKTVSQPLILRYCLSLSWRCVSCRQKNAGSYLHIQSVIFLVNWICRCYKIWRKSDCYFLLFLLLEVELCLCGYLLLGLLITFLLFLGCSFPPCVSVFHLLSVVGLDLWKDIV